MPSLSASSYAYFRELLYRESGINLAPDKDYLIDARLSAVIQKFAIPSLESLIQKLKSKESPAVLNAAVEAMTTNETSFFRDGKPFETLRKNVLPELIRRRARQRKLSIWCAASSSGQEPYSIAMILCEDFPELAKWDLSFVATDISKNMVNRCKTGRFSQVEVNRGLGDSLLNKYFKKAGNEWEIDPRLRQMIDFQELNLLVPWTHLKDLDLVFIRNVLIYFDTATKKQILTRIRQSLKPDGFLYLGGSETMLNIDSAFQSLEDRTGCYHLRNPSMPVPGLNASKKK
jgi:chemotaxis protein methyltransferase CheR